MFPAIKVVVECKCDSMDHLPRVLLDEHSLLIPMPKVQLLDVITDIIEFFQNVLTIFIFLIYLCVDSNFNFFGIKMWEVIRCFEPESVDLNWSSEL